MLVIGSYLSPYVRKVLACLDLKGLAYEIDPIVPFLGDDRFTRLSPLRRVPVLIDDHVTLADSTVICQYLEDRYPTPGLYPADIVDRARARWPVTARYVDRVLAQDCLVKLQPFETLMLRTPIPEHRAALAAAGAPVSAATVGGTVPRRGVMRLP